nr:MAG TPA: hypothetical protein [Caudoviricetes sp.]
MVIITDFLCFVHRRVKYLKHTIMVQMRIFIS